MKRICTMCLATILSLLSAYAGSPESDVAISGYKFPAAAMPERRSKSRIFEHSPVGTDVMPEVGNNVRKTPPMRLLQAGEMLMGLNETRYSSKKRGMHKLNLDGAAEFMFDTPYTANEYDFTTGWVRGEKICGFYEFAIFEIMDYVYVEMDRYTGEITYEKTIYLQDLDTEFPNYLPLYISCAYDPTDDTLWGYTSRKDGAGYAFFTAKGNDVQNTEAIIESEQWSKVCASICYNEKEKALYGVNRDNNFVRIERDGSQTVIMPVGARSQYSRAALIYIPEEDYYIWNAQLVDNSSAIWCIDPKHNSIYSLVNYGTSMTFPLLCTGLQANDPNVISAPIIDKADFGRGRNDGTIDVFMPSGMFSGGSVTGEMDWKSYVDGEQYSTGKANAGEKVSVSFSDISDGEHVFAFDVVWQEKHSTRSETTLFIGYDVPGKPANVVMAEDEISWDPVTRGVSGGYMSMDNLKYHVYINDQEVGVTTEPRYAPGIKEQNLPYAGYTATIVADNDGRLSEMSDYSNLVTIGIPWTIPVHIEPTRNQGRAFSAIDANGDGHVWVYTERESGACMRDPVCFGDGNDDWLFTPPLAFDDISTLYELSLDIANSSEWYRDLDVQVYLCSELNPRSIISEIINWKGVGSNLDYSRVAQTFMIPDIGTYYLAFHTAGKAYQSGICFRNLDLKKTDTMHGIPARVEGLTARGRDLGELMADVEFTMPVAYISGDPIDASQDIQVEITASETVIVSGRPGEKIKTSVPAVQGDNEIKAVTVVNGEKGQNSSVTAYCGVDVPGPVTDLSAVVSEDNLSMHLYWNKPGTKGENGYYVDPDNVEYVVMQYTDNDWTPIATLDKDARDYVFSVAPDAPMKSQWIAIAPSNVAGTSVSYAWMSDMMGTPHKIPAYENFPHATLTYAPIRVLHTTDPDEACSWSLSDPGMIHPAFKCESGVALVGNTSDNDTMGLLMLPKFSTEGVEDAGIVLNIWTGSNMATIRVLGEVCDSEEMIDLGGVIPRDSGWKKIAIPFTEQMQNRKWVALYIQAYYPNTNQFVFVTDYEVRGGVTSLGVDNVFEDRPLHFISVSDNNVVIAGLRGETARFYTPDGCLAAVFTDLPSTFSTQMPAGVYIVTAGDQTRKVIVK